MSEFERIKKTLDKRKANTRTLRRLMTRSSVAVVLREIHADSPHYSGTNGLELLFIKRAVSERDRWSGHMAFPGGRMEPRDRRARSTAIRETHEEIGMMLKPSEYLGRLSDVMTLAHGKRRQPMVVSPYVFSISGNPTLEIDTKEVADVLWLPLNFLADKKNHSEMVWKKGGLPIKMPCVDIKKHYRLWGLTFRIVQELISITHGELLDGVMDEQQQSACKEEIKHALQHSHPEQALEQFAKQQYAQGMNVKNIYDILQEYALDLDPQSSQVSIALLENTMNQLADWFADERIEKTA